MSYAKANFGEGHNLCYCWGLCVCVRAFVRTWVRAYALAHACVWRAGGGGGGGWDRFCYYTTNVLVLGLFCLVSSERFAVEAVVSWFFLPLLETNLLALDTCHRLCASYAFVAKAEALKAKKKWELFHKTLITFPLFVLPSWRICPL